MGGGVVTVRELVQQLSNLDPDLPVYVAGGGYEWGAADSVDVQDRIQNGYPAGVWIQP